MFEDLPFLESESTMESQDKFRARNFSIKMTWNFIIDFAMDFTMDFAMKFVIEFPLKFVSEK